jgi:hypothetical protein
VTRAFVRACGGDEQAWAGKWRSAQQTLTTLTTNDETVPLSANAGTPTNAARRKRRRRISGMAIGLLALISMSALVAVILAARPSAPNHSLFLGHADIQRYCRATGYSGASLDGSTAYDWHCMRPGGSKESLSVIEACRWQYRRPTAVARYSELHNPSSWQCWDQIVVLGRVDLGKYCKALGYSRSVLEGSTTDTWACVSASGAEAPIDPDSACRWQYGSQLVVANIGHLHAPWEHWDCWG